VDESGNYARHFPVLSSTATIIYISISLDLTALRIKVQTSKLESRACSTPLDSPAVVLLDDSSA
jgi:hypothetical protein